MRAICWKELRENYRWAVLTMLALGFAQWYALHQGENQYSIGYSWSGRGLLLNSDAFLAVTTFGCAAAGLLLGFIQILPELRRDRWASLLHRPISRGVVFRGKVAGGLLLYALATVPPFLFSVWLVATPGHFGAPFVPDMALAGTADLCAGAAYHFAALAMTLPRGVWFGTRVFPVLAALHLTYAVADVEFFYVAVEAAVLMSLALFTAGWATMLQQDSFHPRPWIGKLACVVVVFYGACGLGDASLSIFRVIGPSQHSRYVNYNLSDTGVPLRLTYVDGVVVSVTDPAGNPPKDRKLQLDQVRSHIKYIHPVSSNIGDPHGWHPTRYRETYREFGKYLTFRTTYVYPRAEQWFYLIQQKIWVCYSPTKKVPLDRLDRGGFQSLSSPPEPFDEATLSAESTDNHIVYDQGKVTFFVLPQRRSFALDLPSQGPVYGMGSTSLYLGNGNRSVLIVGIALADRLAVYDEKGVLAAVLPYHQDVSRWGQLALTMKGDKDRFYLQYQPSAWLPAGVREKMPTYLEEMDARGELLQSYTLPPLPPVWRSIFWPDYLAKRLQSPVFFFGSMGYQKIGSLLGSQRLADQLARRFGRDREQTKACAVFIVLISVGLAVGAWFWARRARFSRARALGWSLLVLTGGLGGFIVFRVVEDWPLFVACPQCHRPRPIDDERCPNCGAGWPAAPTEGTAIFDDPVAANLAEA